MRRFTCLLVLLVAARSVAQEPSWVGKTIITKRYGIKISKTDIADKNYVAELVDSLYYDVKAEKGNKIQVVTSAGVEGWLDKTDAVLPENAIAHFSAVLLRDSKNAGALQKRAYAHELQGDLDSAMNDINAALQLAPSDLGGWASRGNLFSALKQHDRAIIDYSIAVRFNPQFAAGFNNRGHAWSAKKEYDKAIADFDKAISLDPKGPYAYCNRGLARFMKKEYVSAVNDLDDAQKLESKNSYVYLFRAKMMATSADPKFRNGKIAVEQARKALALAKNPDREFHETLAAAHAEAGDFKEAIRMQERVIEDLEDDVDEDARARLALYRRKMAYRQE